MRLMKIFEVLWLVIAVIALVMAIVRGISGDTYGNYLYISAFTAVVAFVMYRFKKKNRLYLEEHRRKKKESTV